MTNAVLPMESYRLAQYAVQVPCYICEQGNAFDAELCRHCQAPMDLARQVHLQKSHAADDCDHWLQRCWKDGVPGHVARHAFANARRDANCCCAVHFR